MLVVSCTLFYSLQLQIAALSNSQTLAPPLQILPFWPALFWTEPFVLSFSGLDSHPPPCPFLPLLLFPNSCICHTWLLTSSLLLPCAPLPTPFTLPSISPLWTLVSICSPFPPFPPPSLPLFLWWVLQPPGGALHCGLASNKVLSV